MSAHTPGPWTREETIASSEIFGTDGMQKRVVATVTLYPYVGRANARLIAAAPSMWELIENLANGRTTAEDPPTPATKHDISYLRDLFARYRADARAILREVEES